METFDQVVIGAGIIGSCAAWQLARKSQKVLLLEQFHLPHTRGSSTGQTRLIRSCYKEEHFACLMPDALRIWKQIEDEVGQEIIVRTGVLCVTSDHSVMEEIESQMAKYFSDQYERLSSEDLKEKYPYMKYSKEFKALVDHTGGVIRANKALAAVQELFRKEGGEIWEGKSVDYVDIEDNKAHIYLKDGTSVSAKSLVVCAGAWSPNIFRNQKEHQERLQKCIQAQAVQVYYWKYKDSIPCATYPTFINSNGRCIYGLSAPEYPGMMKVCVHGGANCQPDERDKTDIDQNFEEMLKGYITNHLPALDGEPAILEKCMYACTPDENFIIDYLPGHHNVVIGTGFSGSGFKFSPIVGKLLSELALGLKLSHDIPQFKLTRFV